MFSAAIAIAAFGPTQFGGSGVLDAAELITFTSGFQMTVDGHRLDDSQYVLLESGGAIQVPRQDVQSIESIPNEPLPAAASAPASPAPNSRPTSVSIPEAQSLLTEAALEAGLPAALVLSVAKVESAFVAGARSPKGAMGLMQLMPATAAALGVEPADIRANAVGGAQYLRQLLIRYQGEARLALAAYNAGPAAVDRFHDVPPIAETQTYVGLVLREYYRLEADAQKERSAAHPARGSLLSGGSHQQVSQRGGLPAQD